MNNSIDFTDKLDFSNIDLTPPDKVIKEILDKLPKLTRDIVFGAITEYDGDIVSHASGSVSSIFAALSAPVVSEGYVDIQQHLGKQGAKDKKFECYLYTSVFKEYKYRMFFMKYGIANYPVQFTLEESIARDIQGSGANYVFSFNNRKEVENFLYEILNSQKVIGVMQELIWVYKAKQQQVYLETTDNPINEG